MSGSIENIFEQKARLVLKYLKSDTYRYDRALLPPPFFFEFTGTPSSGKTTTITELDKFLRRHGFRVFRPQEGAEVIRHITRDTPLYNIRTGLYALNILIDESVGNKYDVILFDRGPYDAYGWMMYWLEKTKLTEEEKRLIQNFFLLRFWIDKVSACFIMICDPDEAMRRELKIALSDKMGETTNPETIRTLVNRYRTTYRELSPTHKQLHLIDTSKMEEQQMIEMTANIILDLMVRRASEYAIGESIAK